MNLPEAVTTPNGTVSYTYDAAGTKLRKIDGSGKAYHYVSGIHYEQEPSESIPQLKFVQTPEGRYLFANANFEYNLTDHLGNVRVTAEGTVT